VYAVPDDGFWSVPSAGGSPRRLTSTSPKEPFHRWPHILSARAILFSVAQPIAGHEVVVWRSLASGASHVVAEGKQPVFLPTGHLVFAAGGGLRAARFDPERGALLGPVASLLEDVYDCGSRLASLLSLQQKEPQP
jgi:hypothetical protein